jgi:hypothetical protein
MSSMYIRRDGKPSQDYLLPSYLRVRLMIRNLNFCPRHADNLLLYGSSIGGVMLYYKQLTMYTIQTIKYAPIFS